MSRKTSTVVFYQPDEEEVITRPGDLDTSDVERSNVSKLGIIGRKSTESEDSGVRSSSVNEDDDVRRRSRFSFQRFSRMSTTSAPLFDFPSFDELFQSGGETRLTIHRSPTSASDVFPRSHTSPSLAHLQSRADTLVKILRQKKSNGSSSFEHAQEISGDGSHGYGGEINSENSANSRMYDGAGDGASTSECAMSLSLDEETMELQKTPSMSTQRQNSVMELPFTALVHKSFHESKGFAGFRMRLGNHVLHKYCMCCRSDSMPLVFAHVLLGMLIVSAGVLSLVHCFEEVMVNVYMCVDGLFCVFLFPILIMNWTKRVGSCVNENEKEKLGRGTFWIFTVVFRFISVSAGTAVVLYRMYWQEQVWSSLFCELQNSILFYIVFIEWGTIVILLVIPILFYGVVYCLAPYCNDDV